MPLLRLRGRRKPGPWRISRLSPTRESFASSAYRAAWRQAITTYESSSGRSSSSVTEMAELPRGRNYTRIQLRTPHSDRSGRHYGNCPVPAACPSRDELLAVRSCVPFRPDDGPWQQASHRSHPSRRPAQDRQPLSYNYAPAIERMSPSRMQLPAGLHRRHAMCRESCNACSAATRQPFWPLPANSPRT